MPTKTALALMKERNIFKCQVFGCGNWGEEAHHVLYGKKKGVYELNQYENLQLVCVSCHKHTGKALTWENKVAYWSWAVSFYSRERMVKWHQDLPLKAKERYEAL